VQPWYQPQYVIPIAGMIIGNSMNGASLAINRLVAEIRLRRTEIEAALSLGATARQAVNQAFKEAVKSAMIPTINAMMIVGIVQLPGMMTGQIIAGTRPEQAVRYQVVVVYMLTAAVTVTCICAAILTYRQYFTKSHQLKNELL
jgi:putative ABC transport system permease protein